MNDEERHRLGERIAEARTSAGLSKEKAAEQAKVTTTTWRRAEAGQRVQGHKLSSIVATVGIDVDTEGTPDRYPEEVWSPVVFSIPPEINSGYTEVVGFAQAVMENAPPLRDRATRLIFDAAGLLADSGKYLHAQEGGGGNADRQRGPAPMTESDVSDDAFTLGLVAQEGDIQEPGEPET